MTILKITLSISFSEGFKSPWHVSVTLWLGRSNKWEEMKKPGLGAHFLWDFTNIILQTLFRVLIQLMLRTLTFPLWEFRERRTNSIWGKGISRENKCLLSHLPSLAQVSTSYESPNYSTTPPWKNQVDSCLPDQSTRRKEMKTQATSIRKAQS